MEHLVTDHFAWEQRLHASAIKFLIDGHELDLAALLLSATLKAEYKTIERSWAEYDVLEIILFGSRTLYDQFYPNGKNGDWSEIKRHLTEDVFKSLVNANIDVSCKVDLIDVDPTNWKEQLQRILTGDTERNQGLTTEKSPYRQFWQGLHFGSAAELNIAKALDRKGVMYFPGCMARLGAADSRLNREPDFLVCLNGKWGILEVDGELFHQGRAAKDHERGRLFKYHGVKVVEHYDATACRENAEQVVSEFLQILERS